MEAKPHPRTTKQALAEQKVVTDREREARLAAGRKAVTQQRGEVDVKPQGNGDAFVPAGKTDVALPDTRTPQQAYLDEIAPPSSLVGRPIKFDGKGQASPPIYITQWCEDGTRKVVFPDQYKADCGGG